MTVAAAYTKNGEAATLPVPPDLADDLRAWLAGRDGGSPAFALPRRGADMLRVDLAAAGIPYRDAGGLVLDFHALRCQCATLADRAGCSPRVAQRLMRHSTLEMTGRYTRPAPSTWNAPRRRCRRSGRPPPGPRRWPQPGPTGLTPPRLLRIRPRSGPGRITR